MKLTCFFYHACADKHNHLFEQGSETVNTLFISSKIFVFNGVLYIAASRSHLLYDMKEDKSTEMLGQQLFWVPYQSLALSKTFPVACQLLQRG